MNWRDISLIGFCNSNNYAGKWRVASPRKRSWKRLFWRTTRRLNKVLWKFNSYSQTHSLAKRKILYRFELLQVATFILAGGIIHLPGFGPEINSIPQRIYHLADMPPREFEPQLVLGLLESPLILGNRWKIKQPEH